MTTALERQETNGGVAERTQSPSAKFRGMARAIAGSLLADWVGPERAGEATGRISAALAASAASARDPSDFYACTPQSIGQCIAIAALTEIMPGTGAAALAYVVPQRPRRGEDPQLQFMFSHRGLNALARRTGQTMIAIPIGYGDKIKSGEDGDILIVERDIDDPPTREDELRGVIVIVREIANGGTICRGWVPKKLIEARRAQSRAGQSEYGPWTNWYVEMAMKTAMHYAISRGWCVIDDAAATRALSAEQSQDLRVDRPGSTSWLAESVAVIPGPVTADALASAKTVPQTPKPAPEVKPETAAAEPEIPVKADSEPEPEPEPQKRTADEPTDFDLIMNHVVHAETADEIDQATNEAGKAFTDERITKLEYDTIKQAVKTARRSLLARG